MLRKFVSRRSLLKILLGILTVILAFLFRPFSLFFKTFRYEKDLEDYVPLLGPHIIDDASRLDQTTVAEVWKMPEDLASAERQLKELLKKALQSGLKISVAGARHSMGGQTICPNGIIIDTSAFRKMELSTSDSSLQVYAGAKWSDVISYLDPLGYSVLVMQSNNDFSVGGSLSVNCHGWQSKSSPIASTVHSFRILLSNGEVKKCSREENAELFSLVLGGYGLFGVLLDINLKVTPNENYTLKRFKQPSYFYPEAFTSQVSNNKKSRMAFGRLSVDSDRYLTESMLNVFYINEGPISPFKKGDNDFLEKLTRTVFRSTVENEYGKRLRWDIESGKYGDFFSNRSFSRNRLLNVSATVLQEKSPFRTDILHEYFIPMGRLEDFLARVRKIVPSYKGELLNVTIRDVKTDNDTVLRYANSEMFGLVMLFNYPIRKEIDEQMASMTRELIEAAYSVNGTYYLPYRLHATTDQFRKIYLNSEEFFRQKKRYDSLNLFQNKFLLAYG